MAGIFGIQSYAGSLGVEQQAKQLLHIAQQGFQHPSGIHHFASSAIGSALPHFYSGTNWPLVTHDGRFALVVFGEIYLASGEAVREYNFEERFIAPLLASPDRFLLTLDGAFCFALMSQEECLLVNDPFGTFALHYGALPSGFIFSSQMQGVGSALSSTALDEKGVFQTLGLGMCLAGRTLFEGVSRVPGASYLRASRDGIALKKYFVPCYGESVEPVVSTLNRIQAELEESVVLRARYSEPIAAFTGGFDSRATWSIILGKHIEMQSVTHGLPDSSDILIVRKIASQLQIPHTEIHFDGAFISALPESWRDTVRLGEGGLSIRYGAALKYLQMLCGKYPVLLDSFGGAFYRRQRMKVAERLINPSKNLMSQLFRFERSSLLESNILRPEVHKAMESCALNSLAEYYASIEDTSLLGDKLDRYHLEEVGPMKDAAMGNAQLNYIGLGHPLLRLRAIELATTLPVAVRRRNAVHKYVVHASFPLLERFSLDNVGFSTPYRGFSTLRYAKMVAERILDRVHANFPAFTIQLRRPTIDLEHLLLPGIKLAEEILLSHHPEFDKLVDRPILEQTITELKRGNMGRGDAIAQLLGFRLFLDLFVA